MQNSRVAFIMKTQISIIHLWEKPFLSVKLLFLIKLHKQIKKWILLHALPANEMPIAKLLKFTSSNQKKHNWSPNEMQLSRNCRHCNQTYWKTNKSTQTYAGLVLPYVQTTGTNKCATTNLVKFVPTTWYAHIY